MRDIPSHRLQGGSKKRQPVLATRPSDVNVEHRSELSQNSNGISEDTDCRRFGWDDQGPET